LAMGIELAHAIDYSGNAVAKWTSFPM